MRAHQTNRTPPARPRHAVSPLTGAAGVVMAAAAVPRGVWVVDMFGRRWRRTDTGFTDGQVHVSPDHPEFPVRIAAGRRAV